MTPQMVLFNVFVQANTIRGFRYLDDAGKIMNLFDNEFPQKEVGLQGLKMSNSDSKLRMFQMDTEKIWVHVEQPDTLRYAVDNASRIILESSRIVDATLFKRLGLRLNYLIPVEDHDRFGQLLFRNVFSSSVRTAVDTAATDAKRGSELHIQFIQGELVVDFRATLVTRTGEKDAKDGLPKTALLIDPDISKQGEFTITEFRRFLRDAEHWTRDTLPDLIPAFSGEG